MCGSQRITLVACPLGSRRVIPLALPSLAAFVETCGYYVTCKDLNLDFQSSLQVDSLDNHLLDVANWNRLRIGQQIESVLWSMTGGWVDAILRDRPTVVGFSVTEVSLYTSLMLARAIKVHEPTTVTVFGGPECMNSWAALIEEDAVDFVVLGEGERPFVDLLQALDRRQEHAAIPAVLDKRARLWPPRPAVNTDLDGLPYPDFSKMDFLGYAYQGVTELPILSSVGCVQDCTFCSRRFLHGTFRFKSSERIVNELQRGVESYGATSFFFVDSLINGRVPQLLRWTSRVASMQMRIQWHANAILSPRTSRELLDTMRRSGCIRLWYGLESGSSAVLNDMRKYADIEAIEGIIRDTHQAGILITCFLIVGYPTETETDFKATLHFVERNRRYIDAIFPSLCSVEAEAPLGQNRDRYGIVGSGRDWHSPISTLELREARLEQLQHLLNELDIATHRYHPLDSPERV